MTEKKDKTGRPRRYSLQPPTGFNNQELAHSVAQLQELAERVYDQIVDLPVEALDYTSQDIPSTVTSVVTITMLVLHMAWAEAWWVERIIGIEVPGPLSEEIEKGALSRIGQPPPTAYPPSRLIDICRSLQTEYSQPALATVQNIDEVSEKDGVTFSVRGVMGQLIWHWTYHSGQIGLLRLLWGSDYQWVSEDVVALSPH
jgi:hypothetical protein